MSSKLGLLIAAGLAMVFLSWSVSTATLWFQKLSDAKTEIESAGYHCNTDCADGSIGMGGFVVSHEPMPWQLVNNFSKARFGPHWQRAAWVTSRDFHIGLLASTPDGADVRTWGNVVIVGERTLIDEIENALRRRN